MRLSKSLGQVFLNDENYIEKIINALDIKDETVLEIGPGLGQMSEEIAERAKFLYGVEFDTRFIPALEKKIAQRNNVKIINGDILEFALADLGTRLVVFSNAPYQISNPLILYLVKNRAYIKKAYLTFQKEFVNKLIAGPSNSAYGFLSCYLQYYAKVNKIFDIPAKAFSPVPKVDSSFISIDFYKELPQTAKDEDFLFKLIRKAFSQRRKKISNSLSQFTSSQHFFSSLKISPDVRAENISLKQYVAIANRIYCEKFDQ